MFRHYSAHIKQHQQGKSYHFDSNIGFKEVPDFLSKTIECYKSQPESKSFDGRKIFLKFNSNPYAIWFRPFRRDEAGGIRKEYLRIQTFYPIEEPLELEKINKLTNLETNCGFSFAII